MCQHNSNCGCGCQVVQATGCSGGCCSKTKTDNIVYSGPNLSCLGIMLNSDLTTIIQQLTTAVCANTTTSTTTTEAVVDFLVWEAVMLLEGNDAPKITVLKSTLEEDNISTFSDTSSGRGEYRITLNNIIASLDSNTIITNSNFYDSENQSPYVVVVDVLSANVIGVHIENSGFVGEIGILIKHSLNVPSQSTKSYEYNMTTSSATSGAACSNTTPFGPLYANATPLVIGTVMFTNPLLTATFNGGGQWYTILDDNDGRVIQISNFGVIASIINCF